MPIRLLFLINTINSAVVRKVNKLIRISWLRKVMNRRIIPKKSKSKWAGNWTLGYRSGKLWQWGNLLVTINEHNRMSGWSIWAERKQLWAPLMIFWG